MCVDGSSHPKGVEILFFREMVFRANCEALRRAKSLTSFGCSLYATAAAVPTAPFGLRSR